jgi:hypothetical protein
MARTQIIIIIVALFVAATSIYASFLLADNSACRNFSAGTVTYNDNRQLSVALALTPLEHQRGLSGCSSLSLGQGMYFHFPIKTDAVFWMKDMLIPIDIIWLGDDEVIGITTDVPPPDTDQTVLPTYPAPAAVNAVLEVGAGHAKRLNIRPGTTIRLSDQK